jgi:hypothetical protein
MSETIVAKVEIPEFNDYVVMAKKRKAKYKDGKLTNPRAAGTPRLWKINGQLAP